MLEKWGKKRGGGGVSLCLSLNDSLSLVESSADPRWPRSSLSQLLCARLAHWLFVRSAAFPPGGAGFTGQEPRAEGWQRALVLPRPPCTERGERGWGSLDVDVRGRRGDLGDQVEAGSSKRGPVDRGERK